MDEHGFIRSIHRKLPKAVYRWKINDNFAGGVADAYYSGVAGDLWIEYKFVHLPKRDSSKVPLGLRPLQIEWLQARKSEGRDVAIVVGSDEGCILLTEIEQFDMTDISKSDFLSSAVDKSNIVEHILQRTYGANTQESDYEARNHPRRNRSP